MNVVVSQAATAAARVTAGTAPAAGTTGEGFAELLAAAVGAAAAPAVQGANCAQPAALLPPEARCTALIFNEDGFFQAAPVSASAAESGPGDIPIEIPTRPADDEAVATPWPTEQVATVSPADDPVSGAATPPPAGGGSAGSAASDRSAGTYPGTTAATAAPPAARSPHNAAVPEFATCGANGEIVPGEPAASRPGTAAAAAPPAKSLAFGPPAPPARARVAQPLPAAAEPAGTNAQLRFQPGVAEAQVAVQAGPLKREERERLRVEMTKLLARHGFSGATLKLNGSPL